MFGERGKKIAEKGKIIGDNYRLTRPDFIDKISALFLFGD